MYRGSRHRSSASESNIKRTDIAPVPPSVYQLEQTSFMVWCAGIILHDIAPVERAARWSTDFNSNGWLRKNRLNFRPASKTKEETRKGTR